MTPSSTSGVLCVSCVVVVLVALLAPHQAEGKNHPKTCKDPKTFGCTNGEVCCGDTCCKKWQKYIVPGLLAAAVVLAVVSGCVVWICWCKNKKAIPHSPDDDETDRSFSHSPKPEHQTLRNELVVKVTPLKPPRQSKPPPLNIPDPSREQGPFSPGVDEPPQSPMCPDSPPTPSDQQAKPEPLPRTYFGTSCHAYENVPLRIELGI